MKKLSTELLADIIVKNRKSLKMSQEALSVATGINRALLSRIETQDFVPSIDQLLKLADVLGFEPTDVFEEESTKTNAIKRKYKVAVAGTGYVGLSLAVLLSQYNQVTAVDIIKEKVDKLNNGISPIQDDYIEKFLNEAAEGKRSLNLTATTDGDSAYKNADFIIVAAPTNYDPSEELL